MHEVHVVVTGASRGIGAAMARRWLSLGARVTLVARQVAALEEIASGGKGFVIGADLSAPDSGTDWVDAAEAAMGPIDVLVNNAGVQLVGPTVEADVTEGERLLRVDLLAPMRLTRRVLPSMLARGRGTIVDVASMAALAPTPGMFYYNAAKAGLAAASEALRGELRGTGVHVVTVYPGPVDTEMAQRALAKAGDGAARHLPMGDVDTLARKVTAAVDDRRDRVIYPASYGLARHFPQVTRWLMDRLTPPFRGG
ncbi:MAG: SDR family NAD(P)-dependent oxidoreductase [Myxococcales bacterium]|nr:SDR family NAD(P)-dependent oxidoreductase [Myxococcales bacterium]